MEGDFQVCRNCKRSVASVHFTLHEAHCLRFLVFCPECEKPVPVSEMKEHCSKEHQPAKEYQESPVKCKFCDLVKPLDELTIHESHCGDQTERCPHCDWLISLQVLAQHKDICQRGQAQLGEGKRISAPERKICCDYCNQVFPENKYAHHREKCRTISESVNYEFKEPKHSPPSLPSQAARNQTSTADRDVRPKIKNTNRFPHLSGSSTQQAPRGKNGTMDPPLKSELKPRTASPSEDEAAYDILRRCSQCGILLPQPTLNRHQEKCWRLASWKENK